MLKSTKKWLRGFHERKVAREAQTARENCNVPGCTVYDDTGKMVWNSATDELPESLKSIFPQAPDS